MVSDETLLREYCSTGSAEAFATLARRHAGMVYGTCLRITRNRADAEDVAQECFLELARRAGAVKKSVSAYLHTAATNRSLNVIRGAAARRKYEKAAGEAGDAGDGRARRDGRGIGEELAWEEILPHVDRAIAELPDELREPLVLHFLEGLPQPEVAARLGVHQSSVSRRVERGLELVRERLSGEGITATTGLAVLLSTNAATACPATLQAALGKMAVSGVGGAVGRGGAAGAGAVKIVVAVVIVAVLGVVACVYPVMGGRRQSQVSAASGVSQGANMRQSVAVEQEAAGPLDLAPEGFGFVRCGEVTRPVKYRNPDGSEGVYYAAAGDFHVPTELIRQHGLRQDDLVRITLRPKRGSERFASAVGVLGATPLETRVLAQRVPAGRADSSGTAQFAVALGVATELIGERHSYDELMGLSAAVFRFQTYIPEWCPSSPDLRMGFDHAPLAFRAVGCSGRTFRTFGKPALEPEEVEAVVESIRAGYPVLAQSLEGSGHYDVVVGYRTADRKFVYWDCRDASGAYQVARAQPWQVVVLRRLEDRPERRECLRAALEAGIELARTERTDWGGRPQASGFAAIGLVIRRLKDDSLYEHADTEQMAYWAQGAHYTYGSLCTARAAAARFLKAAAEWEDVPRDVAERLRGAAGLYQRIAERAEDGMRYVPDLKDGRAAWTDEMRHAQAGVLEEIVPLERKALEELEMALKGM